jgi:hypothetical protein
VKCLKFNNFETVRNGFTHPNCSYDVKERQYRNLQCSYYSNVTFNGAVTAQLVNDYKWFINRDKTPAIDSFLKISAPKEKMENLLRYIISNSRCSYQIIDSIASQPRNAETIYRRLQEKLPKDSIYTDMYNPKNPLNEAYRNYIHSRYKNASSIEELLKIRPDWSYNALFLKHKEISGNNNFVLGNIPSDFTKEEYNGILEYLKDNMQYGFKRELPVDDLCLNGKTFSFKMLIDGRSDKNVFEVKVPNGKKYVFKMAPEHNRSLEAPFGLGTCAKVDFYLTLNECRNSAPIRYYDHINNCAIYDYVNHVRIVDSDFNKNKKRMPDFTSLGLECGDAVGQNNFFALDNSQDALKNSYGFRQGVSDAELISVDNDHVSYSSKFSPTVDGLHMFLSSGMVGMF